eukprot:COSAG06_NODE_56073_length_286_cov_1.208556_1_plen_41_part_01
MLAAAAQNYAVIAAVPRILGTMDRKGAGQCRNHSCCWRTDH